MTSVSRFLTTKLRLKVNETERGGFGFCQTARVVNLEAWIRRRLRSYLKITLISLAAAGELAIASKTSVEELLAKLDLTPQKPLQQAYQRDPEAVER